jgi:hypothetical protein
MIRWRSATQLACSGEQFADIFRATAQWSHTSHIPVDVASTQEVVDHRDGSLWDDLEVVRALQTGGARELDDLAAHLAGTLEAGWTVPPDADRLRCEFCLRRRLTTGVPPGATAHEQPARPQRGAPHGHRRGRQPAAVAATCDSIAP